MKKMATIILASAAAMLSTACVGKTDGNSAKTEPPKTERIDITANADSIYRFVADQTAIGPRVPDSEAHGRCRSYIADKLRSYGADVEESDTTFTTPSGRTARVRNITGRFNASTAKKNVMLLAHYDTRPWADRDPDEANHSKPIDGANDGASGVAVMLEIARNAHFLPETTGVELLFVDAEDSGSYSEDDTWCIGSQAWADSRRPTDRKIDYAILLDMVGGKDARFHREYFSEAYAKQINDRVWQTAAKMGHGDRFVDEIGGAINDDHLPVIGAGIPCIDIIESQNRESGSFNPTWHTVADNIDNIDPQTMKIVADVVLKTINN